METLGSRLQLTHRSFSHSLSLCPTETGVTGGDIKLKATADTQILQSLSFPEFVSYRDGGDRWRH